MLLSEVSRFRQYNIKGYIFKLIELTLKMEKKK